MFSTKRYHNSHIPSNYKRHLILFHPDETSNMEGNWNQVCTVYLSLKLAAAKSEATGSAESELQATCQIMTQEIWDSKQSVWG
ncbi:hypothetical protein FKM82_003413 [Ascaphus truei]